MPEKAFSEVMELYLHVGMNKISRNVRKSYFIWEYMMELYLQFGYGMMDHCRVLIEQWGKGTVILSPRDLSDDQLDKLSKDIRKLNGQVLLDPQFYLPHSDHTRLQGHDYFPKNYQTSFFWTTGQQLTDLLNALVDLNTKLHTRDFILPGLFAETVDDDWLVRQKAVFEECERLEINSEHLYATVALSGDATRTNVQVHRILDDAREWKVAGIYLVCEHPNGEYLVSDPSWLSNVLDLVAGFRLQGKKVILGYCNHQMLVATCAGANAIASGTWMNVRSFPPAKFNLTYEDEIKQRTKWYYCPQALSEYKIPFLDIAQRQGLLNSMSPNKNLKSNYADVLFTSVQPSAVNFSEQMSFRHYLQCLKEQTELAKKPTFDDTIAHQKQLLDSARNLLNTLHTAGIKGQLRDFKEIIDVNEAAVKVLEDGSGPLLRRNWSRL